MRESLLAEDPEIHALDMSTLVAIASAIEQESVERYTLLAESMERRGELSTAAAFRVMLEEERRHVDAVGRWATAMSQQGARVAQFDWKLPVELSSSWEEAAGSALLTPYRAFAIAAENETRAFAFYTFLSARADDDRVREQAERLAAEELRHASLVRQWRRQAWHRERRRHEPARAQIDSVSALHELLADRETDIAAYHAEIAARLRALGDEESALLLETLNEQAWRAPSSSASALAQEARAARIGPLATNAGAPADARVSINARASTNDQAPASPNVEDCAHLLVQAQKPLEGLAEALEVVMASSEGALFGETDKAMGTVVARLGPLSLQIGKRMSVATAGSGRTGGQAAGLPRESKLLSGFPEVQEEALPAVEEGGSPTPASGETPRARRADLPADSLGYTTGNRRRGASWYRR
jgi:rubrerythrin